jgi:hypothetical protein
VIEFDFKGIKIEAKASMVQHDYLIAPNKARSRHEKNVQVYARFWEFVIDGNLQELALVKSTLNYFMHAYWKHPRTQVCRIDLAKSLHHQEVGHDRQSLTFVARQKDKKHSLQIALLRDNVMVKECYLDGQEVIMLDIVVGKAIHLLTPETIFHDTYNSW